MLQVELSGLKSVRFEFKDGYFPVAVTTPYSTGSTIAIK